MNIQKTTFSGSFTVPAGEPIKCVLQTHPIICSFHVAARLRGDAAVSLVYVEEALDGYDLVAGQGASFVSASSALLINLLADFGHEPRDRWPTLFTAISSLAQGNESVTANSAINPTPFRLFVFETKAHS